MPSLQKPGKSKFSLSQTQTRNSFYLAVSKRISLLSSFALGYLSNCIYRSRLLIEMSRLFARNKLRTALQGRVAVCTALFPNCNTAFAIKSIKKIFKNPINSLAFPICLIQAADTRAPPARPGSPACVSPTPNR